MSLQVVIGGKTAVMLINPIMWLLLLISLVFGSHVTEVYSVLFPRPVWMASMICLLLGNFFYGFTYLLGCMKRKHYHLVKWMLLVPLYWAMASAAAYMALYQLFTKPHYWEKTEHGLSQQAISTPIDAQWEVAAQLAEDFSPLASDELRHGIGPNVASLYAYNSLAEDTIAEMIAERKPALLPSEQAVLLHGRSHAARRDNWLSALVLCVSLAAGGLGCLAVQQHLLQFTPPMLTHLKIAQHLLSWPLLLDVTQMNSNELPVSQLALVPFAWQQAWWQNGVAVLVPALLGYVLTAVCCFLLARRLTRNSVASFFGTLLFVASPLLLPVQGMVSSDVLAIATITLTVYAFVTWAESGRLKDVLFTACCISLMTLTCYEGWLLFPVFLLLFFVVSVLKQQSSTQREATTIVFGILAGIGMLLWLFWNAAMTGNAFSFMQSAWQQLQSPSLLLQALGMLAVGLAVAVAFVLKQGYRLGKAGQIVSRAVASSVGTSLSASRIRWGIAYQRNAFPDVKRLGSGYGMR